MDRYLSDPIFPIARTMSTDPGSIYPSISFTRKGQGPHGTPAPLIVSRLTSDLASRPLVGQLALFSALRAFFVSWRVFINSWVGLAPRPITSPVAAAPRFGSASSHQG
jgi:hypothetical protein